MSTQRSIQHIANMAKPCKSQNQKYAARIAVQNNGDMKKYRQFSFNPFYCVGSQVTEWSEDVKAYSRPIEVQEDGSAPTLGEVVENIFPNLSFKVENVEGSDNEDVLRSSELLDGCGQEGTNMKKMPMKMVCLCGCNRIGNVEFIGIVTSKGKV